MGHAYVIEVRGDTVGFVVRNGGECGKFRFYPALHELNVLENEEYSSPAQVEMIARRMLKQHGTTAEAAHHVT